MAEIVESTFDVYGTFEHNLSAYRLTLNALDERLSARLSVSLADLAAGKVDKSALLDGLLEASELQEPQGDAAAHPPAAEIPAAPTPPPRRWFLDRLEIEGFRGINNEGAPLVLKFKADAVNSVSAPNGVGKSSIYDALSFALAKGIPKLDGLMASEKDRDYYLNLFHPGKVGTVKLVLRPDDGGEAVSVSVNRDAGGKRTVTGPANAEALLEELNREFVLLDAQRFQAFINDRDLERGRSFSGLLGLAQYSALRQALQALANTRAFNSHFETATHQIKMQAAEKAVIAANNALAADFENLVKEPLDATWSVAAAQAKCHVALAEIPLLKPHFEGVPLSAIDVDACLATIQEAEGGPNAKRLAAILHEQGDWAKAVKEEPTASDVAALADLAQAREEALSATAGVLLNELFRVSEKVLVSDAWTDKDLCPTCGHRHDVSVLEIVHCRLEEYAAAEAATKALAKSWGEKGWSQLQDLEKELLAEGEAPVFTGLRKLGEAGTLSADDAKAAGARIGVLRERAATRVAALVTEREGLEKELPPSHSAVTKAVETVRRLQQHWKDHATASALYDAEVQREAEIARIKTFLDKASQAFADAESSMAAARLKGVEPLCRTLFRKIMFSDVVPTLKKPAGSENLSIRLAEFFSVKNVSAQALLSESYRNAFAVSVYLAAASLYGGAPRFVVLDDVTSSFDAGHQHHLIEVVRTQFALPKTVDGPQVILLSHDTLLEKLFNKHANGTEWSHQRLEGNARTAVLLQSGAANKVREALGDLLNAGRIDDAAPRIRQYLEYILHDVIDRLRIPVPMDLAFGDDKRTPGEYLTAIQEAVKLNKAAGVLVLDVSQEGDFGLHSAAIVGNFLAHWSTGQTHAFSAPALLGVVAAIDAFPECFRHEPTPGAGRRYYRSLSRK